MDWTQIVWDDLPGGNVEHVEERDLTTDDVDHVLSKYLSKRVSRSSSNPCVFGYAPDGRYIMCIFDKENGTVIPVTAYEVAEP